MGRKSRLKWERRKRAGWPRPRLGLIDYVEKMEDTKAKMLATIASVIVETTTAERKEPDRA